MDYDYLDEIAREVANDDQSRLGVLSSGEYLYVALSANECSLLGRRTVASALARLGDESVAHLIDHHRYD